MTGQKGKVYLVGAGPGDMAYLTIKAYNLLKNAQVLVYDALVDVELLQLVPPDCLKLEMGKRGVKPSTSQRDINQILVKHCCQGKQVIRLKSGDPLIFGRCTAEIEALKTAGCDFEIVPGISSALAAPLLAGIPLTDPVMSRCFAVLTAHEPDALDWDALSRIETLVVLMGSRHLLEIVSQLLRHQRSPHTPVALVRWAGTSQQQVWTGTLATIVEQTDGELLSPAVIIIGEVVELRRYLQFEKISVDNSPNLGNTLSNMRSNFSTLPLKGKTILVTRAAGQSSQFTQLLNNAGATVIEMPALEIAAPSSWESLDRAIANLSTFDWLILTSSNAVNYFFDRLMEQGQDVRNLGKIKIAVVGEKTAQTLKKRSLQPDFIPPNFVADSLVENFPEELAGKKVLFPRVESGGREVLVKEFTVKGAEVVEVPAYQSCCPSSIPSEAEFALQKHTIDAITFASSKTVKFFSQLLERTFAKNGNDNQSQVITDLLQGVCIASIGPQTSQSCLSLIGRVDVEAEEYTLDGLTQAIIRWSEGVME